MLLRWDVGSRCGWKREFNPVLGDENRQRGQVTLSFIRRKAIGHPTYVIARIPVAEPVPKSDLEEIAEAPILSRFAEAR